MIKPRSVKAPVNEVVSRKGNDPFGGAKPRDEKAVEAKKAKETNGAGESAAAEAK